MGQFDERIPDVADAPERRLRLTPASKIPIKPVRWTWDARIPAGAVTLVPGREGIGKSLFLVWLAAHLTRGTLPGVHEGTPKAVLYAASEDSWERTIAPRLHVAGADLDMVYRVDIEEEGDLIMPLTLPIDCAALEREIPKLGAAMLALDPLMSAIALGIDTHKDRELRVALEPLTHVADSTGCAVVGLAHFNKSSSTDVLNLVTGSRAFTAVLRSVIAVALDPDSEPDDLSYVLSQAKNNLGRLNLPSLGYKLDEVFVPTDEGPASVGKLRFTGEVERTVSDILGERGDREERSERDEATEWLRGYLEEHDGEAKRADILAAAKLDGISERTLERARTKAKVTSKRDGFGQPAMWRLPTVAPQSRQSRQETDGGGTGANGGATGADVLFDPESDRAPDAPAPPKDVTWRPTHRCSKCGMEWIPTRLVATYPHSGCGGTWQPIDDEGGTAA
jgi:AAA domain